MNHSITYDIGDIIRNKYSNLNCLVMNIYGRVITVYHLEGKFKGREGLMHISCIELSDKSILEFI